MTDGVTSTNGIMAAPRKGEKIKPTRPNHKHKSIGEELVSKHSSKKDQETIIDPKIIEYKLLESAALLKWLQKY